MDSTSSDVEVNKRRNHATSDNFAKINHTCSARYGNLIQQGTSRFPIILESLQSKDCHMYKYSHS
ncbi:hypothetical protein D8674_008788 [Pyrus ussuriensis x Pyrus communis]|uniref:Uncharacterized protein n=1 Tax=Pyrus ussuriensis x Pyrus communis TaxID=2448454 RepID=A0A5N5HUD1_9ROSA|nr:hypothetical protein D8674_008788 [Pyrus ussuriensis x Pyrus communis]